MAWRGDSHSVRRGCPPDVDGSTTRGGELLAKCREIGVERQSSLFGGIVGAAGTRCDTVRCRTFLRMARWVAHLAETDERQFPAGKTCHERLRNGFTRRGLGTVRRAYRQGYRRTGIRSIQPPGLVASPWAYRSVRCHCRLRRASPGARTRHARRGPTVFPCPHRPRGPRAPTNSAPRSWQSVELPAAVSARRSWLQPGFMLAISRNRAGYPSVIAAREIVKCPS